jgi:transglutaminase-like putative cysteine protease
LLETTSTYDVEIKAYSAIDGFSQTMIPVNEYFSDFEVVEAQTIKPDGRRIAVAPDKILVSSSPAIHNAFHADEKTRTIVFPDVEVGDTLHLTTRFKDKLPHLAGGFTITQVFPASRRFTSADVTLDVPEDLRINKWVRGLSEKHETVNGRTLYTWSLQPKPYAPDEANSVAWLDREPIIMASSWDSDDALGRSFLEGAAPKSQPTAEIIAKAEEITKGITDRREQARAIYDYVSTKVRYVAIYLGKGGWVPHEAGEIATAMYGDCKDHATLMRALLAAKGIAADYVLISMGSSYKPPKIPADKYNHAILYLPEFDLYTDPTNSYASFDQLTGLADKPVLRVGDLGIVAARTPALSAATNRITVRADVTLRNDGTPVGTATTESSGPVSASIRSAMAHAEMKGSAGYAKSLLAANGWRGAGRIELRSPVDHSNPFVVRTSFDLTNKFFGDGPNKNAIPYGPRLFPPFYSFFTDFIREKRSQDFVCGAGTYEQIIDLHLPAGKRLAKVPDSVEIKLPKASFTATYAMNGQILHVERRFVSQVDSEVCTSRIVDEMRPAIVAAWKDASVHLAFATEEASRTDGFGQEE